jgi:hypothetical protein
MTVKFTKQELRREFTLDLSGLGAVAPLVRGVLEGIEKQTIEVYHPDDEDAFLEADDGDGSQELHGRATLPVSIPEWLCVACQRIRLADEGDALRRDAPSEVLAWYSSNVAKVLFPHSSLQKPIGPAGLDAEIVLRDGAIGLLPGSPDGFKFVVAHELAHAFDAMKVAVPAAMDWDVFWERALRRGLVNEQACWVKSLHKYFLDDYGSESELAVVEEYWPSHAKRWFEALRKP